MLDSRGSLVLDLSLMSITLCPQNHRSNTSLILDEEDMAMSS